jgi:uncharacterized protein (DUF1778 family)
MQADNRNKRPIGAVSSGQADARRKEINLDQRIFVLDADAHEEFLALLNTKINVTKELRARMRRKPSWER